MKFKINNYFILFIAWVILLTMQIQRGTLNPILMVVYIVLALLNAYRYFQSIKVNKD